MDNCFQSTCVFECVSYLFLHSLSECIVLASSGDNFWSCSNLGKAACFILNDNFLYQTKMVFL